MGALVLIPLAALAWLGLVVFFWRAKAWLPYYILGAAGSALLVVVAGRELFPLESLVRQRPSAPASHLGRSSTFVDKHQPGWVKHALLSMPALSRAGHVRPVLLRGAQAFF